MKNFVYEESPKFEFGLQYIKDSLPFSRKNRLRHVLKSAARIEASEAIATGLRYYEEELAKRPRLRLAYRSLFLLGVIFMASSMAVSFLKPQQSNLNVGGRTILVGETTETASVVGNESEITQDIISRRSPFIFKNPLAGGVLTQGFQAFHKANDIAGSYGADIHPLGSGMVEFAGTFVDGRGNVVIIDHGDNLKSLYAHLGRINVGVGNMVSASTALGTVGMTGHTTGPHVHIELFDNGVQIDPSAIISEN